MNTRTYEMKMRCKRAFTSHFHFICSFSKGYKLMAKVSFSHLGRTKGVGGRGKEDNDL